MPTCLGTRSPKHIGVREDLFGWPGFRLRQPKQFGLRAGSRSYAATSTHTEVLLLAPGCAELWITARQNEYSRPMSGVTLSRNPWLSNLKRRFTSRSSRSISFTFRPSPAHDCTIPDEETFVRRTVRPSLKSS